MSKGNEMHESQCHISVVRLYLQLILTKNPACRPTASDRVSPHSLVFLSSESRSQHLPSHLSWGRALFGAGAGGSTHISQVLELGCLQDPVPSARARLPAAQGRLWSIDLGWFCCPCLLMRFYILNKFCAWGGEKGLCRLLKSQGNFAVCFGQGEMLLHLFRSDSHRTNFFSQALHSLCWIHEKHVRHEKVQ